MARKKKPTNICPLCDAYVGFEKFMLITHLCAVPFELDGKGLFTCEVQVDLYMDTRGETRNGEIRDRIYVVFTKPKNKDYVVFKSGYYNFPPKWELVCGTVSGKVFRTLEEFLEL